MLYIRGAVLAFTTLAFIASGCGSTKSSGSATSSTVGQSTGQVESAARGKPLTRPELIAEANAICRRITAKLNSTTVGSQQETATILPQIAAYEHAAFAELHRLTPPASLGGDWQKVVASIRMLADNTATLAGYASSSSRTNFVKAERALSYSNFATRRPLLAIAAHDGFSDCAQVL